MGDFSTICAISHLPITRRQKIVAIPLEPGRWASESGYFKFVPTGFPIIGEYDYRGGIEGTNIMHDKHALVHYNVWINARSYWHHLNRKSPIDWFSSRIPEWKEEAAKEKKMCIDYPSLNRGWTDNDCLYYGMHHDFNKSDYGLVFRRMIEGKDVSNCPKNHSFLERNAFMEAICTKINSDTWTDKDTKDLNRMIWLWGGEYIIGHHIRPSGDCWIEQYPEYNQRIKILERHLNLAYTLKQSR